MRLTKTIIGLPTNRAPTHPSEMLNEEFLKPLAIKQKDAADDLGISLVRLNEIIKGDIDCDPAFPLVELRVDDDRPLHD